MEEHLEDQLEEVAQIDPKEVGQIIKDIVVSQEVIQKTEVAVEEELLLHNSRFDARTGVTAAPVTQPPFISLRNKYDEWCKITKDRVLLEVIKSGVRLNLSSTPSVPHCVNNQDEWAQKISQEMVSKGVVRVLSTEEVKKTHFWTPVKAIPKKSGGMRLITDLRNLNKVLTPQKSFKMEDWKSVLEVLASHNYSHGATLDLKDYFHHLSLHKRSRRLVRWKCGNVGYEALGLPFGLACSPYWTARLSKPLVTVLRQEGITVCWYVDDLLVLGRTEEETKAAVERTIQVLNRFGVVMNFNKSKTTPVSQVEYLGTCINLTDKVLTPGKDKLASALKEAKDVCTRGTVTAKRVAGLGGRLLFLGKSVTGLKGLAKSIIKWSGTTAHRDGWKKGVEKPPYLHGLCCKIILILSNPVAVPFYALSQERASLAVDACENGWGAVLKIKNQKWTSHGPFFAKIQEDHITVKEVKAMAKGIETFHPLLKMKKIGSLEIHSDCITAVSNWNKGASSVLRESLLTKSRILLAKMRVLSEALYLPGVQNTEADYLSRLEDKNEVTLDPYWFNLGLKKLGTTALVDAFACAYNKKAPIFWSRTFQEGCAGVNAFAQSWSRVKGLYLNPPWNLIHKILLKLIKENVKEAIIITPVWKSAIWWPILESLIIKKFIPHQKGLFIDKRGRKLPSPRWSTQFALVSAKTQASQVG